jgi:hypothetical protein
MLVRSSVNTGDVEGSDDPFFVLVPLGNSFLSTRQFLTALFVRLSGVVACWGIDRTEQHNIEATEHNRISSQIIIRSSVSIFLPIIIIGFLEDR